MVKCENIFLKIFYIKTNRALFLGFALDLGFQSEYPFFNHVMIPPSIYIYIYRERERERERESQKPGDLGDFNWTNL